MWIRSQNKVNLWNCNKIWLDCKAKSICEFIGREKSVFGYKNALFQLGKYKTLKRCLEVMDGINEALSTDMMWDDNYTNIKRVYQMPEK
jgi:hypothetical protein